MKYKLTKSKYIKGLQCNKALYLDTFFKHLAIISKLTKKKFETGRLFESIFKTKFSNGVALDKVLGWQIDKYPSYTKALLTKQEDSTLFEAGFIYNEVLILTDVLCKTKQGITIYEIKNSTKLTNVIWQDVCLQYYICKQNIPNIIAFNVVLNDGNDGYIVCELLNKLKEEDDSNISKTIQHFKDILSSEKVPNIDIGLHCNTPYECEFKMHCSSAKTLFN